MSGKVRAQSGFTLLEMLLVLGIIAISVKLALPLLSTGLERNDMKNASNTVIHVMEKAKRIARAENTFIRVDFKQSDIILSSYNSTTKQTFRLPDNIISEENISIVFSADGVPVVSEGESIDSLTRIVIQHSKNTSFSETISVSATGLVAAL